jgi:hypothetical protein
MHVQVSCAACRVGSSSGFLQFLQSKQIFLRKTTISIFCSSRSTTLALSGEGGVPSPPEGGIFHGQTWLVARGAPHRFTYKMDDGQNQKRHIKISLRMENKLHHMLCPDVMYYGSRMVQVSPLDHDGSGDNWVVFHCFWCFQLH